MLVPCERDVLYTTTEAKDMCLADGDAVKDGWPLSTASRQTSSVGAMTRKKPHNSSEGQLRSV